MIKELFNIIRVKLTIPLLESALCDLPVKHGIYQGKDYRYAGMFFVQTNSKVSVGEVIEAILKYRSSCSMRNQILLSDVIKNMKLAHDESTFGDAIYCF